MRMTTRLSGFALMVLGAGMTGDVYAGTATSNMSVTASIANNCTIGTVTLAFGVYDPITTNLAAPLDGTSSVTVNCTNGWATNIDLDQGLGLGGGSDAAPVRFMSSGPDKLGYQLYSDAGRSVVWGKGVGFGVAYTGTGTPSTVTIFGRIPSAQQKPAGSYSDTIVASINF